MSRGKRLNSQIKGDQEVLSREETLRILSEMTRAGSVSAAIALERACLGTARREGLIRQNPAADAVLPHRPPADDDEERARPFPRIEQDGEMVETMELVVALIHPDHRLMFELLAATGVRRSELIALEGRHLHLSGERPYVSLPPADAAQNGGGARRWAAQVSLCGTYQSPSSSPTGWRR
jgi:integrase